MDSKYNFSSIALTGATSSIGTAIIRECIENGIEVLAFLSKDSAHEARIPHHPLVHKVYCSLEEMADFDPKGLSADVFFHLGWAKTNRALRNDPGPQVENIRYALDSVALAEKLHCRTYLGAGSQAEYGRHEARITESAPVRPETAYGMAKLCAGQMTRLACGEVDIRHIWPRIFSTYGPNSPETTIINYTITCLRKGRKPELTGCEQIWDFLYVDDAARALLALTESGRDGEVYNISAGAARPMRDYIEIVRDVVSPGAEIGYGALPYDPTSIMHLEGDIGKIQRETGWKPRVEFAEGIRKTCRWMD